MPGEPSISARRTIFSNRWVTLVEKDLSRESKVEQYYNLAVPAYICVIATTPDGLFPLVRQYRPAVEQTVWEFPSGTLEPEEALEECARRELFEEAGCVAKDLHPLGVFLTDVGRLNNRLYAFYAPDAEQSSNFVPEEEVEAHFFTRPQLDEMIASGVFNFALHLATWEVFRRRFDK